MIRESYREPDKVGAGMSSGLWKITPELQTEPAAGRSRR